MRITRTSSGIIVDGRSEGRGAWLCRSEGDGVSADPTCLDTAIVKGAFARAWRGPVSGDEERKIRERVASAAIDAAGPGAH